MAVRGWQSKNRVKCVPEEIHELGKYWILGVDDESIIEIMFAALHRMVHGHQQEDSTSLLSIDCHIVNSQRHAVLLLQ